MTFLKSFCFFILIFIGFQSQSQILADSNLLVKERIEITYKWKNPCFLNPKSPVKLKAKIKNLNDYDLKFTFKLAFYKSGILIQESDTISKCLRANKSINGRKQGLVFDSNGVSTEEVLVEFIPVEILRMRSCK